MLKPKYHYICSNCNYNSIKWSGQCPNCIQWNTFSEIKKNINEHIKHFHNPGNTVVKLNNISVSEEFRITTKLGELDRVLGGGLVYGSVTLIGGYPGIGKSTMLLQALMFICNKYKILYVTGEESLQQIKMRAQRLGLDNLSLNLFTETNIEIVLDYAQRERVNIIALDSIQTVYINEIQSTLGSVNQVRATTSRLVSFAKQTNTTILLIGHVTKDGSIAGPKILEHMVDTVLYFEGDSNKKFRILRAVKNRFGTVNEIGIFTMTNTGLREVKNPSAIFLSKSELEAAGSVVMITWEGSRPMFVEIQALVHASHIMNPRRVSIGLEQNRLALILAVLSRHAGVVTYNQDVFINVVGGIKIYETGIDLAVAIAVVSSLKNKLIPKNIVVFGEIGLSGEIRSIKNGQERIKEAAKLGFTQAIVPKSNLPKNPIIGITVNGVGNLSEALAVFSSNNTCKVLKK